MESLAGRDLGAYRLGEELGRGGMGAVYRAEATAAGPAGPAGTAVAVKVFHPHLVEDTRALERFEREAEIGKRIRHEHVVRTFDVGSAEVDGQPVHFMVMEIIEGQTLDDLVRELGTVPEHLLYQIADQVLDALETVHERGIVHRDIKPENIVITPDHRVLLMDLGVARLQERGHTLTQTGEFVGSLFYASPEQFLDTGELGPRSDLYAFGVVLYKLATGTLPFEALDISALLGQKLQGELAPPREANSGLDAFWNEVIVTATRRDVAERFASAAELRRIIQEGEESDWWKRKTAGRALPSAFPALKRLKLPREVSLIGRKHDLDRLGKAYDKAAAAGGVLLLGGAAGVGKSRLVFEFLERMASAEGPAIAAGRCAGTGARSYQPFVEAFTDLLEGGDRKGLEARLTELLPDTPGVVPRFVDFLLGGLQPGPESGFDKDALLAACANVLRRVATERPIVLAVEDLHLAGPGTLELFSYLARCVEGHKILLVGVYTEEEVEEGSELQAMLGRHESLQVHPLTPAGTEDLVRAIAGRSRTVRALAWPIHEKSDGNPLIILELIAHLRESGDLVPFEDHLELVGTLEQITLPSNLQELVSLKLGRLDDAQRETLEAAAVLGYEFEASLLGAVLEEKKIKLLQRMAVLERKHRLVRSSGRGSFRFASHQLQEAIYESISPALRVEYHALVADTVRDELEDEEPEGEVAFDLLRHLLRAERGLEADPFLQPALDHLAANYHASAAIPFLEKVAETFRVARPRARLAIAMKQWAFYEMTGQWEDELRVLSEAQRFAEEIDEPGARGRVHSCLAATHWYGGEHDKVQEEAERALPLLREAGDRKWEAKTLHNLGSLAWRLGDSMRAIKCWRDVLEMRREIGDRRGEASTLLALGIAMRAAGERQEAFTRTQEALAISQEIGDRRYEAALLNNLGNLLQDQHRYEESVGRFEEALEIARELGDQGSEATTLGNAGCAYAVLGRIDEAKERLDRAIEVFREIGRPNNELIHRIQLARAIGSVGEREAAESHLRQAIEMAERIGDRNHLAHGLRNLGWMLHQWGRREDAWEALERARAVDTDAANPEGLAQTLDVMGHAALNERDFGKAVLMFETSLGAAQGGDTSDTLLTRCRLASAYKSSGRPEDALSCAREAERILDAMDNVSPEHGPEIHYRLWQVEEDEALRKTHLTRAQKMLSTRAQSITNGGYREHFLTQTGHNPAILEEARRVLGR